MVALTVTDNTGVTGSDTVNITVNVQTPLNISLSVKAYKVRGLQKTNLSWSGATTSSVDVWRNGAKIAVTSNDGFYTDNINKKGGGTYTYKVCNQGSSTECSNESTAAF